MRAAKNSLPLTCMGLIVFLIPAFAQSTNDWLIIPGQRVGPIHAHTSRADLDRLFGKTNVVDEHVGVDDVGTEPGSIIFKARAYDSLTIVWTEDRNIKAIIPCHIQWPKAKACHWHTRDGITHGTSLKKLERLNGGPFELVGFGFDYGGAVTSWNGLKLSVTRRKSCGKLYLRLDLANSAGTTAKAAYDKLQGDKTFSSNNPDMQKLNPVVDWISLLFSDCP